MIERIRDIALIVGGLAVAFLFIFLLVIFLIGGPIFFALLMLAGMGGELG